MTAMHLPLICMAVWREWTECYAFVSSLYMTVRLGGLTATHLSLICVTVRLGALPLPYMCLIFIWQ